MILARDVEITTHGGAYRLAPQHSFPAGLEGRRRALNCVSNEISNSVFIGGHSAGRHYAALPASLTKNKHEHTFPIGKMIRVVIDQIPAENDFLLPAQRAETVFGGWGKQKAALDELCPLDRWTLHDLRRTFAHQWQRVGVKSNTPKLRSIIFQEHTAALLVSIRPTITR